MRLLLALAAIALAGPLMAQGLERRSAELLSGITFSGDGAMTLDTHQGGARVAQMWRPVRFGASNEPLAGRMDCRATAWRTGFSSAQYDVEEVYAAEEPRYQRNSWTPIGRNKEYGAVMHRLDIVARRRDPLRYTVQTYIAVRTGDDLVNIRRNCTFIRGTAALRIDYLKLANRFTGFGIDLPAPAHADPLDTPSHETLVDIES